MPLGVSRQTNVESQPLLGDLVLTPEHLGR
jgi:hypothetical protein